MIRFPNAKINLGLDIVERRADGYHNIETVFYPIPLNDILECVVSTKSTTTLSISGNKVDCPMEKNLVYKAYTALAETAKLPPVDIFLHKAIPDGAGLGGGSSDASNMLLLLNDIFGLNLTLEKLAEVASKIGADCPFFIYNRPLSASGIGNVFSTVEINLKGRTLLLVKPDVYISTKEAYSKVVPAKPSKSITEILSLPIEEWRGKLKNDFEPSAFAAHPELGEIKDTMYRSGAIYASMSGSGSAMYAIYNNDNLAEDTKIRLSMEKSWIMHL